MFDWDDVYNRKQWQHCPHCHDRGYRHGFFDAGSAGLIILVFVIIGLIAALR